MKLKMLLAVCSLTAALTVGLAACGENAADTSGQTSAGQTTSVQQGTAQETEYPASGQEEAVQQELPKADPKASIDGLIGEWTDIGSPDRFAKISKTETGYQYEDNEGTYPAEFKEGELKIKVSDSEEAEAFVDTKTGHMLSVYQGGQSEFEKK